jgi:hypothetical protein
MDDQPQMPAELLRIAAQYLQDFELGMQHDVSPAREAVQREIVQAATCIGRALHLIGDQTP